MLLLTLLIAILLGTLIGAVVALVMTMWRYRTIPSSGTVALCYADPGPHGELRLQLRSTSSSHPLPCIVDTGYAGTMLINEACCVALANHVDVWDTFTAEQRHQLIDPHWNVFESCPPADCDTLVKSGLELLNMEVLDSATKSTEGLGGTQEEFEQYVRTELMLGSCGDDERWIMPDDAPVSHWCTVSRIAEGACIMTLDYLLSRIPVSITFNPPHLTPLSSEDAHEENAAELSFGVPPPADARAPVQTMSGGVFVVQVVFPEAAYRPLQLVLDTGFPGFITLDREVGMGLSKALCSSVGSHVVLTDARMEQRDVHGARICTTAFESKFQVSMEDGGALHVGEDDTPPIIYVSDSDISGADGLLGLSTLEYFGVHFVSGLFLPRVLLSPNDTVDHSNVAGEIKTLLQDINTGQRCDDMMEEISCP